MRIAVWLAVWSCAGVARASFDLMYIPDTSGTSIHRWDPVNRVYLGAINAPARYVAARSSSSTLVTCATGDLPAMYNGSTGEFIGATTSGAAQGIMMRSSGTEFLATSGAVVRRYDATTGSLLQTVTTGGTLTNATSFAEIGSGRIALIGTTASGIVMQTYSSTLGYIGEFLLVSTVNVSSTTAALSSMAFVSLGGSSNIVFTYRDAANATTLARVGMASDITPSSIATTALTGFSTTSAFTTTSVMAGHGGSFFVTGLSTTSTSTRIKQMYINSGLVTTTQDYTTSAFVAPSAGIWAGTNVVAPEPGPMLGLGLGVVALLRRRKRA